MNSPKYIENENIPWALTFKSEPEFCITKITPNRENLLLHYTVEGRGFSIYSDDQNEFSQLPSKIEIILADGMGIKAVGHLWRDRLALYFMRKFPVKKSYLRMVKIIDSRKISTN